MRQKNDIPADAGHFLRIEIDSIDFKKWKFSYRNKKKAGRKAIFFLKNISKDIQIEKTIRPNKYLKKILDKEINQWNI